jgi:hypothetical protein
VVVQHGHVLDEGEIALGLGRDAAGEPPEAVVGYFAASLVERERRVGDDPVVKDQLALLDELRVAQRVACPTTPGRRPDQVDVSKASSTVRRNSMTGIVRCARCR